MAKEIRYDIIFDSYYKFKSTKSYEFITGLLSEYKYRMNDTPYNIINIDQCLKKKANAEWYHHVISVYYDDDDNVFIACFCKKSIVVFAFPYIAKVNRLAHHIIKDLLQYVKTNEQDSYSSTL